MRSILVFCFCLLGYFAEAQCSFNISTQMAPVLCHGESNGIIVVNVSPIGSYNFQLGGGAFQSNNIFSGLNAGSYWVKVQDPLLNCTDSVLVAVTEPNPLVISAASSTNSCNQSGSIILNTSGGNTTFTYEFRELGATSWNTASGSTISSLDVGLSYEFQCIDNNGCYSNLLDTFIEAYTTDVSSSFSCSGGGQFILSSNNANTPITHSIAPAYGTFTNLNQIDGLAVGNYTITSTDGSGCSWTKVFPLGNQNITKILSFPTCMNSNGNIYLAVTGTAPINYTLNGVNAGTGNAINFSNLASGTYTIQASDAAGCSTALIVLLPNAYLPTTSSLSQTSCGPVYINGLPYSSTGVYTQTLTNAQGCDSILTLNLTIYYPPSNLVNQNGNSLSAVASGVAYQWMRCNPFQIIAGANSQTYNPTQNGQYAVILTQNNCSDTSTCYSVNGLSLNELNEQAILQIYPNPSSGDLQIRVLQSIQPGATVELRDIQGRFIQSWELPLNGVLSQQIHGVNPGMYFIAIHNGQQSFVQKWRIE